MLEPIEFENMIRYYGRSELDHESIGNSSNGNRQAMMIR